MVSNLDKKLIAGLGGIRFTEASNEEKFKGVGPKGICANLDCASKGKKRKLNADGICRGCWRLRQHEPDGTGGSGI